jgi:hypothetical protein
MLAIRDRSFDVSSATFGAILSLDEDAGWRFQWSFEFTAIGREFVGATWQPRLYAEALKLSLPAPSLLPGHSFFVEDAYNEDEEPNFSLYVFEHEPAYDMRIDFGRWQGDAIELTLSGKADVNWDDDYGRSLPIRVECMAAFEGINVWDRTEESARARLTAFYDPVPFAVEKSRVGFNYRMRPAGGG